MAGGLTRCALPSGSPFAARPVCPTGCASCRTPVGGSHPPLVWGIHISKKPVLSYELFLEYGGGIDSLRSPFGQPVRCAPGLSNWLRQLSNPGRWFSSPLGLGDTYKQKARTSVQALNLNMAVRGGFEPPIRCRIHTFQACSFSHSDTSPYCIAA